MPLATLKRICVSLILVFQLSMTISFSLIQNDILKEYDSLFIDPLQKVGHPSRYSFPHERRRALLLNDEIVQNHKKNLNRTYEIGLNSMSDLTFEQYEALLQTKPKGFYKRTKDSKYSKELKDKQFQTNHRRLSLPASVDWSTINGGIYMTAIKNQGSCGSCWAFAAAATIESTYAIEKGIQAFPLSIEQILDCTIGNDIVSGYSDRMYSSARGCQGGMPFLGYYYMENITPYGVEMEKSYPYLMSNDSRPICVSDDSLITIAWNFTNSQVVLVEMQNENALMEAVSLYPVSASLDASGLGFKNYVSGVYDAEDCSSDGNTINHAVDIVGYGETDDKIPYWKIRNHWGTMWGEAGYMRIIRNGKLNGPCNLYLYSAYVKGLGSGVLKGTLPTTQVPEQIGKVSLDLNDWVLLLGISFGTFIWFLLLSIVSDWFSNRTAHNASYEQSIKLWRIPSH